MVSLHPDHFFSSEVNILELSMAAPFCQDVRERAQWVVFLTATSSDTSGHYSSLRLNHAGEPSVLSCSDLGNRSQ